IAHTDVEALVDEAYAMTCAAVESSDVDKLGDAVVFARKAADACIRHPILRSRALDALSQAHNAMLRETGKTEHVEQVVEASEEAATLCPPTHSARLHLLSSLATALYLRFRIRANLDDLDRCIALEEQVVATSLSSERSGPLNHLADFIRCRFQTTGNLTDLDQSITLFEESLEQAPASDRPGLLRNLATSLTIRFRNTAHLPDLEKSVVLLEEALGLPQSDYDRCLCLSNLATSLWTRYEQTRNIADLDKSFALHEEALKFCPSTYDRPHYLDRLAVSLIDRFHHDSNDADLNRAIDLQEEAVALCPQNHVLRSRYLSNLAISLNDRFDLNNDSGDFDKSTGLHEEALRLCAPNHIHRHRYLINLVRSLSRRFQLNSGNADLDRSIELAHCAVSSLSLHHPSYSECLRVLSDVLLLHIQQTQHADSVHECTYSTLTINDVIGQLRKAANAVNSPSHDQLRASLSWVDVSTQSHQNSLCDAYHAMFNALDTVVTRGHSLESRYIQLTSDNLITTAKGRITDAISFAITENLPRDAVIFLERGRAFLLAQLGHCRTRLDVVRQEDARLAAELDSVSRQLDLVLASNSKSTNDSAANDAIARSMNLTWRWNTLVEQARKLDGCHDFLLPTPFEFLQQGASGGPVIFISVATTTSYAIIVVHDGNPAIVPLPNATSDVVDGLNTKLLHPNSLSLRNFTPALRDLWDIIVGPVVDQLKSLVPVGSRIWWCPSAAVANLPLHAAGHHYKSAGPETKLFNLFVSSYTSSLGALIRARRPTTQSSPSPRLLIVSQPNTPGEIPLNVEDEVNHLSRKFPGATVLEGTDGTRDAVIKEIPHHPWVHFSCHGYSIDDNPFRSYFSLHGSRLEVLDILRTRTPDAELAVLTACHTAGANTSAPEEFLHLAGAMQFAGFRSVVGTLWAMDDEDGSFVVKEFYDRLLKESRGPEGENR
ncbi:hypothetical protein FRB99_001048, partial [Tulasnella sp. 403]